MWEDKKEEKSKEKMCHSTERPRTGDVARTGEEEEEERQDIHHQPPRSRPFPRRLDLVREMAEEDENDFSQDEELLEQLLESIRVEGELTPADMSDEARGSYPGGAFFQYVTGDRPRPRRHQRMAWRAAMMEGVGAEVDLEPFNQALITLDDHPEHLRMNCRTVWRISLQQPMDWRILLDWANPNDPGDESDIQTRSLTVDNMMAAISEIRYPVLTDLEMEEVRAWVELHVLWDWRRGEWDPTGPTGLVRIFGETASLLRRFAMRHLFMDNDDDDDDDSIW